MHSYDKQQLIQFLVALKETLGMLGSSHLEHDDSGVRLTHCQKYYLAKLYQQKIDNFLSRLDDTRHSEW